MRAELPADIDSSEGSHTWNFLRPAAMVAAELYESILPQVIQIIFPEWSYETYLDEHAKARGITRRAATAASGDLTITGIPGSVLPVGSTFSTAASGDTEAVEYASTEEVTIDSNGDATVPVRCTETGPVGNTMAGTVILTAGRMAAVTSGTNEAPITGGTSEESDDDLRERISQYDKSQGMSFVGSISDYKRWASSVDGVGSVTVIDAQDDTGLVTLVLTDTNGDPATEDLCTAVYNHIMQPDNPEARLAPVNAYLSVTAPETVSLAVSATVEPTESATLESIAAEFLQGLAAYMPAAMEEREVKYTRIAAVLSATAGVNDYSNLLIGVAGTTLGTANISIASDELPAVAAGDIDLTIGSVT